ncbi:MAG: patatin-like phospholipase family protein [Myxococcota bacterium]
MALGFGRAPTSAAEEPPRRAIVLSGGGARGAYEAGVLSYVFEELPARLGFMPRLDVYAGTSVGAVHCCFLAAHADELSEGVRALAGLWRRMSFSTVYRFGVGDAFNFSRTLVGSLLGRSVHAEEHPDRIHGLLNTTPLEQLVVRQIPWRRLRRNLRSKVLDSLCVSTTEIATGRTVTFIDNREREVGAWTGDPMVVARSARIGPDHALASAAIPVLFPAVKVRGTYFCDGSLRQYSPLSPALRLRCNRILSIGLRRAVPREPDEKLREARIEKFRSAGFMFGKILNTLLIDRLDHDILQMRLLNRLLLAGLDLSGPEFLARVNRDLARERGFDLRVVQDCLIRPSEDIGMIAAEHVRSMRRSRSASWMGGMAFRVLTRGAPEGEADLMSYLLFDGEYASSLIELGRADAARAEDELVRFFSS